jgi:Polyketide cyclase / dehydrase and lipid transport
MIAHVDVQIPFPIATVWDLLTDLPRMASLSPEVESARWLTDEDCVQGARFLAHNRPAPSSGR